MSDRPQFDEVDVEFILLADGAHAVGGKLYVLGGGWTHLWLPQFPMRPPVPFSVALAIRIPWALTNRQFHLDVQLVDSDGAVIETPATGDFEQGRPPGMRPGTPQRFVLAFPVNSEIPRAGRYLMRPMIDGQAYEGAAFEVQAATSPLMQPQGH